MTAAERARYSVLATPGRHDDHSTVVRPLSGARVVRRPRDGCDVLPEPRRGPTAHAPDALAERRVERGASDVSVDTIPKACAVCGEVTRHTVLATLDEGEGMRWVCTTCIDEVQG